jgi:hypothetical protein
VNSAVRLDVMLGRVLCMLGGMDMVAVGQMSVASGCFVVSIRMMLRRFVVVACSVLVMFRCLGVMMRCFV